MSENQVQDEAAATESAPATSSLTYRDIYERDRALADLLERSFSKSTLAALAVEGFCNELWLRGTIVTGFKVASVDLLCRAEKLEGDAKTIRSLDRTRRVLKKIEEGTWRSRRPRRKRRAKL